MMASPLATCEQDLDLRTVCAELGTVQFKWYKIGVHLGIPPSQLMGFQNDPDPFSTVIYYWLRGNVTDSKVSISWKCIVAALKTDHVAEFGLAKKITAKYCQEDTGDSITSLGTEVSPSFTTASSTTTGGANESHATTPEERGSFTGEATGRPNQTPLPGHCRHCFTPHPSTMPSKLTCGMSECYTPSPDCWEVQEERERLRETLGLECFSQALSQIQDCVKVAYTKIDEAGPDFQNLKIAVETLKLNIGELFAKSANTFDNLTATSSRALGELNAIYPYLLSNREELALYSFEIVTKSAEKMALELRYLHEEFVAQEPKVVAALEQTQRKRATGRIDISYLKTMQEKAKLNIKLQEECHEELEMKFREETLEYAMEEENTASSFRLIETENCRELRGKRQRQRFTEKFEKEKKLKDDALHSVTRLIHDIKEMESKGNLTEKAVLALHTASGCMKHLIIFLKQSTLFWGQFKEQYNVLADDRLQRCVQMCFRRFCLEERRDYWTTHFKHAMFRYSCKWVALHYVNSYCVENVQLSQHELHYDNTFKTMTEEHTS